MINLGFLTNKEQKRYKELLKDDYTDSEKEFWELHHKKIGNEKTEMEKYLKDTGVVVV